MMFCHCSMERGDVEMSHRRRMCKIDKVRRRGNNISNVAGLSFTEDVPELSHDYDNEFWTSIMS